MKPGTQHSAKTTLPFESSFGHLVRSIHRMQGHLLQLRLAEDGVSLGCWYFLRVLWEEDMITQRELSIRTGVNEATTRTAVDRMESQSLVTRRNDPRDRRKRYIELTDRARGLEPTLIDFADHLNRSILDILPPEEQEKLIGDLSRIHDHVKALVANTSKREAGPEFKG